MAKNEVSMMEFCIAENAIEGQKSLDHIVYDCIYNNSFHFSEESLGRLL